MSRVWNAGASSAAVGGSSAFVGPAVLALCVISAVAVFWIGFTSLVDAWSVPEYSHGPIIPLISTFLFLREMRMVPPIGSPPTDRWPGVAVLAFGLVIGVVGNLTRITDIVTYGFMVWFAGLVLISFGLRRGLIFWPALLHLVFMLPLPNFLYWQVSVFLQTVSSQIGVAMVQAVGIPVYLDGNIIDLGIYKLQVAEACSGLRYLFPMLSFSYVFGVLYQGPAWHKIILLLAAAPITVLMNSFRIGMIGILVNYYGIEHAEGFLHTFEGWIIFIACVLILFALASLLQRFSRDPRPLSETLDISFEGLGEQFRRWSDVTPSAAMLAAALITASVGIVGVAAPDRIVDRVDREPFVVFPREIAGRTGSVRPLLDPEVEAVLAADDYFNALYTDPSSPPVDLFMAYYHDQMDGTGIHSPEVCLPVGGWEVSSWDQAMIPLDNGEVAPVNRAVIQKGTTRQLVYFWFELRGRRILGPMEAKFHNMVDSMLNGRSDGALVRLITPIDEREPVEQAEARLATMMSGVVAELPRFVPE